VASPNRSATAESRILFLDYLRIFAFTSVLVGHKFHGYLEAWVADPAIHATPRALASMLLPFVHGGGAGVIVFFLVSGYIITHVLQTEQTADFLIKRFFRIYPLYVFAAVGEYTALALGGRAPELSTLLLQLTLMGDFFGAPYALNGVEWTLRVEVVFYLVMALARSLNLTTGRVQWLPHFLLGMTLLAHLAAPIPSVEIWAKGYLTIHAPFLLLGAMFYLYERKGVGLGLLLLVGALAYANYYALIAVYQKAWLGEHFALLALLVFVVAFVAKDRLSASPWVLLLSDMTYAVYLFHNWLFDYVKKGLGRLGVQLLNADVQALLVMLLMCYAAMWIVEKPAIRLGRRVVKAVLRRKPAAA